MSMSMNMNRLKNFSQILAVYHYRNCKPSFSNPSRLFSSTTTIITTRTMSTTSTTITTTTEGGKRALVVIAEGSEEIEAVTPIDVLRRAGVEVTVAGLKDANTVICSRNVILGPDVSFADAIAKGPYDAVILPGGLGGAKAFSESKELGDFLKEQETSGRLVAAICAGPTALKAHDIGLGKSLTSYPSVKDQMAEGDKYKYSEERVVVDGNLITSRGPGTAMEFALALVENLVGKEKADEVAGGLLFKK